MTRVSVFDYLTLAPYLRARLAMLRASDPGFSARTLAAELQVDAGSLSRMLAGKRRVPKPVATRISLYLNLESIERAYFDLLANGDLDSESVALIRDALRSLTDRDASAWATPVAQ